MSRDPTAEECFTAAVQLLAESDYATARRPGRDGTIWRATFYWLLAHSPVPIAGMNPPSAPAPQPAAQKPGTEAST